MCGTAIKTQKPLTIFSSTAQYLTPIEFLSRTTASAYTESGLHHFSV